MKIILNKNKLVKLSLKHNTLGFVPTMGALHKGHLNLIKRSKNECEGTIVSIFINKPQFNKKSDFIKYPKLLQRDKLILRKIGIDYLYIPNHKSIYPNGINKRIKINPFEKKLCGKFRPGHFKAVVDVIDRFVSLIKPTKIYFGEKDLQQLIIIKDFIRKNYKKTKVIKCKTLREKNGIALSSRNLLLTQEEKKIGGMVYRLIKKNKESIKKNFINFKDLKASIYKLGVSKIDYIKLVDINKIIKPFIKKKKYKVFYAYHVRNIRLIDNI